MSSNQLRDIPSLNSLRAFEAAARHLNFRVAAEELFITPSAVSHQIKTLEQYLDVELFKRMKTSLSLTAVGENYYRNISGPMASLALATQEIIQGERDSVVLTISLLPSFASRWLIPRLSSFQVQNPNIELRFATSVKPVDFRSTDIDVAIRYGDGDWSDLHCDHIVDEEVVPVCCPALLKNKSCATFEDLANFTFLHNSSHPEEWAVWLRSVGSDEQISGGGLYFPSSELTLRAAAEGLGVALGRSPYIDDEIRDGRLVKIFESSFSDEKKKAYYLVCLRESLNIPVVEKFRAWILSRPDVQKNSEAGGSLDWGSEEHD